MQLLPTTSGPKAGPWDAQPRGTKLRAGGCLPGSAGVPVCQQCQAAPPLCAGGADSGCGIWAGGTTREDMEIHWRFRLCLEFVVKVLDVELVCEALQVGVAGPACRWASAWKAALHPSFCSQVAVTFGLGPLQERCIAFIETHTQEALRTRGFLELSAPALLPLLRSDKLCVDEAELVLAARSWARVGAAVLERPVAEVAAPVVRELRLALLAPAELSALEEQNQREPLIPVEQIVEAWKCHALRRGDAARGTPCRRRRGTLPREHHCFLDLPFK
ncbi:BTB/POZ domain-containing protein 19 isoform X4 [Mustela erminea]|uniref:BTB/POZ domain-containing protein 19 isoform X4 n=1 Tax=Mustela erminea TaxID=36723 RepID=UPI0013874E7B|nr:BTB/POZ domain-containing protein 19 isoform X4 [Mustela erminea]XP_032158200.1 BTB/POZ domain-containing protein 19 isoform X4 [Mustela erminea]XP_032158201.1 BTB/POZ domain-containing protein 19 isoform X4 [Mustela erminea]